MVCSSFLGVLADSNEPSPLQVPMIGAVAVSLLPMLSPKQNQALQVKCGCKDYTSKLAKQVQYKSRPYALESMLPRQLTVVCSEHS
jgi:hypothetical protein